MSRLYEALRQLEPNSPKPSVPTPEVAHPVKMLNDLMEAQSAIDGVPTAKIHLSSDSRLVALSDPDGLGAEKFRVLATRLANIRRERQLKTLQVTSSVGNEGKSLVAANLAATLAIAEKSKVLLVEGDLRRPTLASLFGFKQVKGLAQWWTTPDQDLMSFLWRLDDLPLWFLGAGEPQEQPAKILQSARLLEGLPPLVARFDWVVVDSTPMLPVADANLWSRIVDGTLLVVREGVAPVNALKKGLESLDNPKLIGVVLNEASEFGQDHYKYSYYNSR